MTQLSCLETLSLTANLLTKLPPEICKLHALKWLYVTPKLKLTD